MRVMKKLVMVHVVNVKGVFRLLIGSNFKNASPLSELCDIHHGGVVSSQDSTTADDILTRSPWSGQSRSDLAVMAEVNMLSAQKGAPPAVPALFVQHAQPTIADFALECFDLAPVSVSTKAQSVNVHQRSGLGGC